METITEEVLPTDIMSEALGLGKKLVQSWQTKVTLPRLKRG
jgi:hypothetical protein